MCARIAADRALGRALLVALLERIKSCPGVEQVTLTVVSGQEAASALYRSLGFETYGLEPRGLKVGDRYFDNEHMVLFTARNNIHREPAP